MGCLLSTLEEEKPYVKPASHAAAVAQDGVAVAKGGVVQEVAGDAGGEQSTQLLVLLHDDVTLPDDEEVRWDALNSYNILDTEPEDSFDSITKLCKTLFKVPIAMITFVDRERVWLKSVQGLTGLTEVDRRYSICAWTLLSRYPEALVVSDLREDIRFKDYPVVTGWPHVVFYAAAPLVSQGGQRLGTLCILDYKPRVFSAEQALLMTQLSGMVMREVERKRAMNDALCNAAVKTTGEAVATDRQGVMLLDASHPKWAIHLANPAWERATGLSTSLAAGANFWDLFEAPPMAQLQACKLAVEQRRNFELRVPCARNPPLPRPRASTSDGSVTGASVSGSFASGDASAPPSSLGGTASTAGLAYPPTWPRGGPSSAGGGGGGGGGAPSSAGLATAYDAAPAGGTAVSLAGGARGGALPPQRWVCLQFRSASSPAAMAMGPAISIPPTLATQPDRQNYYWVTVDRDTAAGGGANGGGGGGGGGAGGVATADGGVAWSCAASQSSARGGVGSGLHSAPGGLGGGAASGEPLLSVYGAGGGAGSSVGTGGTRGPSDGGSDVPATPARVTTFNLLPEENPFQDITLGSLLGWGSYGRVHRGYWNGSLVAIKILEQVAGDFNPRTALEPLLHHRLSHPHIVKMYDVSTQEVDVCEDGRPLQEVWMVLEYCARGTLTDAVARGAFCAPRPPPPLAAAPAADAATGVGAPPPPPPPPPPPRPAPDLARVVAVAADVADAMAYLHGQNVLHGDLNGNNILLASGGAAAGGGGVVAKVADFGLSRLLPMDSDRIVTRTHGTITHMAPEVITESLHSKAADVYSFGVVLWELVSCAKPYAGLHYAQIVHAVAHSKGLEMPASAPPALQRLLRACLAPRPEARPAFSEVVGRLRELQGVLSAAPAAAAAAAPAGAGAAGPPASAAAAAATAASVTPPATPAAAVEPPPAAAAAAAPEGGGNGCFSCDAQLMAQAAANPPPPQRPGDAGSGRRP